MEVGWAVGLEVVFPVELLSRPYAAGLVILPLAYLNKAGRQGPEKLVILGEETHQERSGLQLLPSASRIASRGKSQHPVCCGMFLDVLGALL